MPVRQRAERLQFEIRMAILENTKNLSRQMDIALENDDIDEAKKIQVHIKGLRDQLDDLSRISLDLLEESDEVKITVRRLQKSTEDLEDEADKITDLESAIRKGASIVKKGANLIAKLKGLIPVA